MYNGIPEKGDWMLHAYASIGADKSVKLFDFYAKELSLDFLYNFKGKRIAFILPKYSPFRVNFCPVSADILTIYRFFYGKGVYGEQEVCKF